MNNESKKSTPFIMGLVLGMGLMWLQLNYYSNDWHIVASPELTKVYAVERGSGHIKLIRMKGTKIYSYGLSSGDKLDPGEWSSIELSSTED